MLIKITYCVKMSNQSRLSSINNYRIDNWMQSGIPLIKIMRGRYILITMPDELIFGSANSYLECRKCMQNATWRGVLIGGCTDCSSNGFSERESTDSMPRGTSAKAFGFDDDPREICRAISIQLDQENSILKDISPNPRHIEHDHAYSFYGIAELPNYSEELSALLDNPIYINQRYNCRAGDEYDPRWMSISRLFAQLSEEFDPFSLDFFKKCKKLEKEWTLCKTATTQAEVDTEMGRQNQKKKHECQYCSQFKYCRLCAKCKGVRYCSIACQSTDWKTGGAYFSVDNQPSVPHKDVCDYLKSLRTAQEAYDVSHSEIEDVD